MKFLHLITFGAVVAARAIVPFAPKPMPDTLAQMGHSNTSIAANDVPGSLQLHKLLSRDASKAYNEAKRAAGRNLTPGTSYYFMSCTKAVRGVTYTEPAVQYVLQQTGDCVHVGLFVGKVSSTCLGCKKKFDATILHVVDDDFGRWQQKENPYSPRQNQRLVYGGEARSNDVTALKQSGQDWVNNANVAGPGGGRAYDATTNCLTYYRELLPKLTT